MISKVVSYELDKLESMRRHTPLYRLRAEQSIKFNDYTVPAGTIGGLVEHQWSIDNSWLESGVMVVGEAKIKNCLVRGNTFIAGDVHIIGNGHYLGGNAGDITINGDVTLKMECPIDMGPITLTGNAVLTGNGDIISISGLFNNKGYGTHFTAYKTDKDIFCYANGLGLCNIKDLTIKLLGLEANDNIDEHIFDESDSLHIRTFAKHLTTMIKSYFK